jgi:RNA polymerase sigma factor (sigma-70 family)
MKDNRIIELLKTGKNDKAFAKLYSGFPAINKFIQSKGGSKTDAQDVFQEALIVFYRKVTESEFVLTSSISTYLYSVCRFLWKDELNKRNRQNQIDFTLDLGLFEENQIDEILKKEEQLVEIEQILQEIGKKCLQILTLFYYKKTAMKEIAKAVDLRSEQVVKAQKYRCIQKAKERLTASNSKKERDEK